MFNMNLENIKGKRVLIVGMGKSGIAAAQAMLKLGANVTIQDSKEREKADAQLLAFLEGKNVKCYFHQIPEHVADFDKSAPSGIASRLETLGDFRPGNGIVAQALLSVSRRSASLHRPQGALGSGPPKPLAWDRSLPPPVAETGRRSVGNRKECRLRHDYASFPGPQTPSSLRAYSSVFSGNRFTRSPPGR